MKLPRHFFGRGIVAFMPLWLPLDVTAQATVSWGSISGRVVDAAGVAVRDAIVSIEGSGLMTRSDESGAFSFARVTPGTFSVRAGAEGYAPSSTEAFVRPGSDTAVDVRLERVFVLDAVDVSTQALPGTTSIAPDILNGLVLAGTSNTVIRLQGVTANLAEKTPRQLFARVPGVFTYDMDGSGNQVNVSTRGLDPHRSWELNVRQDGVLLNSDLYGYPAAHYSPPMEAIAEIEMIRGTAALQYGSQYGGLLNYVTKQPEAGSTFGGESSSSIGSYGLMSTYNALGGRFGPATIYGYFSERRSEGYRRGAKSDYAAQYLSAEVELTPSATLRGQVGRTVYTYKTPGALLDAQFEDDPRQSTRSRDYYSPDITVPAVTFDWRGESGTQLTATVSGVFGPRESVQFIGFAGTPDVPDSTGQYPARQVDIDRFRSLTGEVRFLQPWTVAGREHTASVGVGVARNHMTRQQIGQGSNGTDFDLTVTGGFRRDISYKTLNAALYVENMFRLAEQWTITPGTRVEIGRTKMEGQLAYYDPADVPTEIEHSYPLFGVRTEYAIDGGPELYGGWSQAYRPQILKDVLPANALERTDPDLEDSRGWTVEAGARGTLAQWLGYDIGVFEMRINDRFGTIIGSDAGGTFLMRTNVGTTRTRGAEVSLEAWLVQRPGLSVWAHTATSFYKGQYLEGTVVSGGQNVDIAGNELESVPRVMSRSGLSVQARGLTASALLTYADESFADALNTVTPSANAAVGIVPSYTVLDLNAGYEVASWLTVRGGVNNVLDRQYFTKRPQLYPGGGVWPSDGRTFQLSADLSAWR
jgi:Fe(3+) dicitrate transport protein